MHPNGTHARGIDDATVLDLKVGPNVKMVHVRLIGNDKCARSSGVFGLRNARCGRDAQEGILRFTLAWQFYICGLPCIL